MFHLQEQLVEATWFDNKSQWTGKVRTWIHVPAQPISTYPTAEKSFINFRPQFLKNYMIPRASSSSKIKMLRNKDDYNTTKWHANHLLPQDGLFLLIEIITYHHFSLSCHPGSPTTFNNNNNKIKIRYLELVSLKKLAFAFLVHKETYSEICLINRH